MYYNINFVDFHRTSDKKIIRRNHKRGKKRNAFSLMELMVVIVILGLLSGLVVLKTRTYLVSSKQNAARVEIAKIGEALEVFYSVHDRYPTNEEGIDILVSPSEEFVDGLLSKLPLDPWKHPYQYNAPGRNGPYEVVCYGADGREGGEGADMDIVDENTKNNDG